MSHTQAGTIAYKKAPAGTTVEVGYGTTFPVDWFGIVEVDLDQPGATAKPVKMVSVAYVPELSWNLLSPRKAVKRWGKPLVYYKTKAVLGFPGERSLVFNLCPRKGLFSTIGVRWTPSQEAALGLEAKTAEAMKIETTGQWGPCADVRRSPRQGAVLAVAAKARNMIEVHRVLAHPSVEITKKMVQAMEITTTGQYGTCETRLQVKTKRQAMQWINEPGKTGSNGVGDEDLNVKLGDDESVGKREALQLDAQELELEQQLTSQQRKKEGQKAPPNPEKETREAPTDLKVETNCVARLTAGSTDLEGLVVPALRKLTTSGNIPHQTMSSRTWS